MNLTLTQSFHRTQNLSGEIKAAQSALADCEADHAAKQRIASIAAEAVETARSNLAALEQEREDLAEHMAGLVRCVGVNSDPRDISHVVGEYLDETTTCTGIQNGEDARPLFADPADELSFQAFGHPLQNGDDTKINAAFEAATQP